MPHRLPKIIAAREQLALDHKLSQQEALLMALLVYNDMVTKTKLAQAFGSTDASNLVSRLRTRLRKTTGVTVQTVHGWGYCLEPSTRTRLMQEMGEINVVHATEGVEGPSLSGDAL